jgi:hypothetical protein
LTDVHISGNKQGGVMPGDTATHLVSAVAEMWGRNLSKFWLTNYLLTVKDLGVIAERLPKLDTLMLRMSESTKNVSDASQFPLLARWHRD